MAEKPIQKGKGQVKNKKSNWIAREPRAPMKEKGMIDTLPLLKPPRKGRIAMIGDNEDLTTWREKLQIHVSREYGEISEIFKSSEYPDFMEPELDRDEFDAGGARKYIEEIRYSNDMKLYTSKVKKLSDDKPKVHAVILGQLSSATTNNIKLVPGGLAAIEQGEPLELLKYVISTHIGGTSITDKEQLIFDAQDSYRRLRQFPNEPTADYLTRFRTALQILEALEELAPSEAQQALSFHNGLDNRRYADHKLGYINRQDKSKKFESLEEAYQAAAEYVTPRNHRYAEAFAATGAGRGGRGGRGRGRGSGGGRGPRGPPGVCWNCHQPGHRANECTEGGETKEAVQEEHKEEAKKPSAPTAKKKVTVALTIPGDTLDEHDLPYLFGGEPENEHHIDIRSVDISKEVLAAADKISRSEVGLDTCAGASIFSAREFLSRVYDSDDVLSLNGINKGGGALICDRQGDSDFGTVYFSPDATINILSYSLMKDQCHKVWQNANDDVFRVQREQNGDIYLFRRKHGIYVHDMASTRDIIRNEFAHVASVEENKSKFAKHEVRRAEMAREFARAMANPSVKTIISMVNEGRVSSIPFTAQDVQNAEFIWGRSLANLKGKTTSHKAPVRDLVERVPRPIAIRQVFSMDLMFVEKIPFLVSIAKPVDYLQVNRLKNRTTASIYKQVKKQLAVYTSRGFQIDHVRCDPESGLVALRPMLGADGFEMDIAGQEEAVPEIERPIRTIKERARGIIHTLPWNVPLKLLVYLVFFVVLRLSQTAMVAGMESPFERVHGRKIDFRRHLKASFGDYVQAHRNKLDNTMNTRTDGGIALYDTGNVEGTWYIFNLATNELIRRNHFNVLPVPQIVVDHLNSMARGERRIRGPEPIFEVGAGKRPVLDVDDEDSDADYMRDLHQQVAEKFFRPRYGTDAAVNDPVQDIFHSDQIERDTELILEHPDTNLCDVNANKAIYEIDDDADTVSDIGYAEDDNEVFDAVADAAGIGGVDSDSDDAPVADAQTLDDVMDDGDSDADNPEPTQIQEGPTEDADSQQSVNQSQGRYNLRDRSKVKAPNREYGLHLSIDAAVEKLGKAAIRSIVKEMYQLERKKVFKPIRLKHLSLADRRKIVGAKMFLKEKYKADGSFEKLKARLVAQQFKHLVFNDGPASPTAATSSILLMAGLAARERRAVATIDFPGAYLNATMRSTVVIKLNAYLSKVLCEINGEYQHFCQDDGTLLLQLNKALYGCVESARLWYEKLSDELKQMGFTINVYDNCVFNRTEPDGTQTTLVVHVDDMFVAAGSEANIDNLISQLNAKFDDVSCERGSVLNYLGMVFDFSKNGKVSVSMEKFMSELMEDYSSIEGLARTPATNNLFRVNEASEPLGADEAEAFHTCVAKLLYLCKRVRSDVSTAIAFLTSRVQKPTVEDQKKLYRVIQYLRATRDLRLTIDMSESMEITAFIDASFGVHLDMKSHTGIAIILGQGLIYGSSTKQRLNTKSSTEAELVGVSDGLNTVIWCRNFLIEQGYQMEPIRVCQDNQSTIRLIKNGKSNSEKTRHIAIRFFFITDNIERREIKVEYVPTEEMVADIFTKPLQGQQFIKLRNKLLNI